MKKTENENFYFSNRKVASVSGDCRRALDICRRATEIAEEKSNGAGPIEVNFAHINQALSEMFASPKVRAIKNCTKFEKLFLQAVASEIQRTGIEEVEFHRVFWQIGTLAPILGIKNPPNEGLLYFFFFIILILQSNFTSLFASILFYFRSSNVDMHVTGRKSSSYCRR